MRFVWSFLRMVLFAIVVVIVGTAIFGMLPNSANATAAQNFVAALGLGVSAAAGLYFILDVTLFTIIRHRLLPALLAPTLSGIVIGIVCAYAAIAVA